MEKLKMNNYHEISKILEMKRPTLALVSILQDMEPHTLRELEQKLLLRQPEVSRGVNELLKKFPQFFEENVRIVDGRGRPEKLIKMVLPVSELKKSFNRLVVADFNMKIEKLEKFDFKDAD